MTTTVATWGNSAAVRIPKAILKFVSLRQGDEVEITVNERGNIEIRPAKPVHRHVAAAQGVTYESLFAGYGGGRHDSSDAWLEEDMQGAEAEVWS